MYCINNQVDRYEMWWHFLSLITLSFSTTIVIEASYFGCYDIHFLPAIIPLTRIR